MKINFDITAQEFHIIHDILAKHLHHQCKVWVFGSRAKNKARFNSDLDLAIEYEENLPKETILALKEDFDDAKITFSVDIVELNAVEDYFKTIINSQKIIFPMKYKIPVLRFSEFSWEWESKKIGKVLTIGSGKDYKHLAIGNIPVYGTGGYMLSVDSYLYDGESVCIGRKGTIDKPVLLTGKFWTVDTLFYTHSFINSLPKFIYAYFQTINWKNHNEASGVPSLSKTTIENIDIKIPTLPEQQKIADFLTAIDEKITQLTQKAQLLARYKKGVMQQIFSQEIRFTDDDGREFSEWEYKTLEELANVTTGDKDTQNKVDDGIYPFFVRSQTIEKINSFSYDGEAILTSGDGVGVGKNFHYINGKFDYHQRVYCIHNFKNNVLGKYIFFYFSEKFNKLVMRMSAKNSVDSVRRDMITDMPIFIPSFPEQTKIANFLTALDNKIALVNSQLNGIKQYKKGLLQQLFV